MRGPFLLNWEVLAFRVVGWLYGFSRENWAILGGASRAVQCASAWLAGLVREISAMNGGRLEVTAILLHSGCSAFASSTDPFKTSLLAWLGRGFVPEFSGSVLP
jgi:hypothetical protein